MRYEIFGIGQGANYTAELRKFAPSYKSALVLVKAHINPLTFPQFLILKMNRKGDIPICAYKGNTADSTPYSVHSIACNKRRASYCAKQSCNRPLTKHFIEYELRNKRKDRLSPSLVQNGRIFTKCLNKL